MEKRDTHSINRAFQSSSDLVNAYRALHVEPKARKLALSNVSSRDRIISSGRAWRYPIEDRRVHVAIRPLPDGLTPRGWAGMASGCLGSDSASGTGSAPFVESYAGAEAPSRVK